MIHVHAHAYHTRKHTLQTYPPSHIRTIMTHTREEEEEEEKENLLLLLLLQTYTHHQSMHA